MKMTNREDELYRDVLGFEIREAEDDAFVTKLAGTLLILQIISVFQIMYEPMVLTKGGPDNASLSLMQLMWQYAFGGSMDYGKASAVAVIVTIILLGMTAVYSYFNNKESDWD